MNINDLNIVTFVNMLTKSKQKMCRYSKINKTPIIEYLSDNISNLLINFF